MSYMVIDSTSNSLIPRQKREVFEYDEKEFCYSAEAQDRIESLLMGNYNFSITFNTEETARRSAMVNNILLRVSGYGALAVEESKKCL